jgi:hypothetical protein
LTVAIDPGAVTDDVAGGRIARAVFAIAWVVVLALYLSHAIVLSSDSMNNHVHVWYIADDLWHHGRLPWHMPVLAHGDAYAYPYGFLNWTTAALLWPVLGNWVVTLWTALGAVGCLVATFVAFPELRRGWWAAAALANPAIIEGLLFGQQSFLWASMLFLFGVAEWRRGKRGWAAVLIGIAQATHAAIVLPMGIVVFLLYIPFTRDRAAAVRWYALSCLIALPAVALAWASVTTAETNYSQQQLNFWGTLGPRVLIVVLPWFSALLRHVGWRWLAPAVLGLALAFSLSFEIPLNVGAQWTALVRRSANTATLDAYLRSPQFVPGATYRVLRGGDGKLGLYKVLLAGGRLDSEMFPEGMAIRNFDSVDEYAQLLCDRHIDQVLHFDTYDSARHTNEGAMLDALANGAPAAVLIAERSSGTGWQAFTIDRTGCP